MLAFVATEMDSRFFSADNFYFVNQIKIIKDVQREKNKRIEKIFEMTQCYFVLCKSMFLTITITINQQILIKFSGSISMNNILHEYQLTISLVNREAMLLTFSKIGQGLLLIAGTT